jgi:hypothetical protein
MVYHVFLDVQTNGWTPRVGLGNTGRLKNQSLTVTGHAIKADSETQVFPARLELLLASGLLDYRWGLTR